MFNLSKKEHLESLMSPLRRKGFYLRLKDNKYYKNSYVSLTITDKRDYLELKLKRKWMPFGHYHVQILCSNLTLLGPLEKANQQAEKQTGHFNFRKKKFHRKVNSAISNLWKEHKNIVSSAGGMVKIDEMVSRLQTNPLYEEKLSVFDFIRPAIGLEMQGNNLHPVFGMAVGGDLSGGLIFFDPWNGQLELGAYMTMDNLGLYTSFEFDLTDLGDLVDIDWD
jgi:hypothetical protein